MTGDCNSNETIGITPYKTKERSERKVSKFDGAVGKVGNDENSLSDEQRKSYEELALKVAADNELNDKNLDYKFLIKFLLCHKFDVNASLHHIKQYFEVRKTFPGLYSKPSEVMDVYRKGIMFRPNVRGPNGEGIMIIRANKWRPSEMTPEHAMSAGIAYSELVPVDDDRRRAGLYEVIDAKGLNWSQIWSLKLSDYKLIAESTEIGQTLNFNAVIIINASYLVDFAYNKFLKWFFSKDFRDKIMIFSGDWTEIFEFVPRNAVPVDMKGTLEGPDLNNWSAEQLEKEDKEVEEYWQRYK